MSTKAAPVLILEALVASLKAGTQAGAFSLPLSVVEREYTPVYKPADLETVRAPVVYSGKQSTRVERGRAVGTGRQSDYVFEVGLYRRVGENKAEIDRMILLAEEVDAYLIQTPLTLATFTARCLGVTIDPVYSWEDLLQDGLFVSTLQATYRVFA